MAQEQIQRAPIDRRTDIYAAGAVFWEMLAGQRLVRGENDAQLLAQILNAERRSVQALNPAVPEEIEAVCQCALQRAPDDRHATAAAFGEALEAAAKAAGVAIAAPRDVATFVKELKAHESPTDSPSGSLRKPAQSAARAAITAPASTGSVRSEVGPISTHAAAIAPVLVAPAQRRVGPAVVAAAGLVVAAAIVAGALILRPGSPPIAEPGAASAALAPNIAPADRDALRPAAAPVPGSPAPDASTAAPASSASSRTAVAASPPARGTPKAKATPAAPRPTSGSPTHFRPTEL
jgi:serine/threonine-protein kinase